MCVIEPLFLLVAFVTPLTYTAYLGQSDVRFNCSAANARSVAWSIDGEIRQKDWLENRGIETVTGLNHLESSLIITSTILNNNTSILCLARHFVGFEYEESAEVTFRVQGQLVATDHRLWVCDICDALFCRYTGKMP